MKVFTTMALGVVTLFATAFPLAAQQAIEGSWTGEENGNTMTFTFREDGTGSWQVETTGDMPFSDAYEFRYNVDYDAEPNTIDIFEVDHGPMVGQALYGVVQFEDNAAISLDFEMGPPGDDSIRPADLSGAEVARFVRATD